jgi:hypothetical protein
MGGTGADQVMLSTGDAIFWSDGNGNPTVPPSHIANPNGRYLRHSAVTWLAFVERLHILEKLDHENTWLFFFILESAC